MPGKASGAQRGATEMTLTMICQVSSRIGIRPLVYSTDPHTRSPDLELDCDLLALFHRMWYQRIQVCEPFSLVASWFLGSQAHSLHLMTHENTVCGYTLQG